MNIQKFTQKSLQAVNDLEKIDLYIDVFTENGATEIDCEVLNYSPVRLTDDDDVTEVMSWCSEDISMTYSMDDVYILLIVEAENAQEYLEGGKYDWMCFYVTENHYNDAEALFNGLAA